MAYVICQAALERGLNVKQSEVHGMAQRGGAVQSHVRLSPKPIASDLIPKGMCNLLIGVEPLESIRYIDCLSPNGTVVTSMNPYKNIPDYPEMPAIWKELDRVKSVIVIDAESLAKQAGSSLAQNTVVLGAASLFLDFPGGGIESWVSKTWEAKGECVVQTNMKAFDHGRKMAAFLKSLAAEGASPEGIRFLSQHVPIDRADPGQAKIWSERIQTELP